MYKTIESLQKSCDQNVIAARSYLKEILGLLPSYGIDLVRAMDYAVGEGGKMRRSNLMMLVANLYGIKTERILPMAAALELMHDYSLVHDDLPALDNDDMRRGKISCHKKFGEATAILVGDGLLTMAFGEIIKLRDYGFDAGQVLQCIEVISYCAGPIGMIMGQALDLDYKKSNDNNCRNEHGECYDLELSNIMKIHTLKTGMLFSAATKIPSILAGFNGDKAKSFDNYEKFVELSGEFGLELGKLFQIHDDIEDAETDSGPNVVTLHQEKLQSLVFDIKANINEYAVKLFDHSAFGYEEYMWSANSDLGSRNRDDYAAAVTKTQQLVEFIFGLLGVD